MAQKRNAVVVVAAGSGVRAGGGLPKQYQLAGGAAVLRHTLSAFIGHPDIHIIQPVIGADHQPLFDEYCDGLDVEPPVAGGAEKSPGFAEMCSRGRHYGLDMIGVSQRIAEVSTRFRGNCSETVVFRQKGPRDNKATVRKKKAML